MTIKDLTPEQAFEITKLLFPFPTYIKSELEFNYFSGDYGDFVDTRDEVVSVKFISKPFPPRETDRTIIVHIYPNLDLSIGEFEFINYENSQTYKKGYYTHVNSLPVRNLHIIFKKFTEWGQMGDEIISESDSVLKVTKVNLTKEEINLLTLNKLLPSYRRETIFENIWQRLKDKFTWKHNNGQQ